METEWYRFGAALAIGALVGLERHVSSNVETLPEPELDLGVAQAAADAADGDAAAADDSGSDSSAPEDSTEGAPAAATMPVPPPPAAMPLPPLVEGPAGLDRLEGLRSAGLRTFMLVALSGALSAHLSQVGAPWAFAAALTAVGALTLASYIFGARRDGDLGLTSEVSLVGVFLLGGLCVYGDTVLAGACAVTFSVILSLKKVLHARVGRMKPEDVNATLKFAVLTLIILPILPAEPLVLGELLGIEGEPVWWHLLSIAPRKIWLMVVLISGVSFAGYVLGQVMGAGRGMLLTGAVGGLVSSTAVSLSFSQRSTERPELSRQLAGGILLANALMPARLLLVTSVIAPALFLPSALPLLAMVAVVGVSLGVLYFRQKHEHATAEVMLQNPFEIGPALKFGALFGVVLFLAQVLQELFGETGLYVLAVVTGLTDVDAIGLAVASMVSDGERDAVTGMTLIALAAISNTVVKGGFVAWLGSPQLRRVALGWFAAMAAAGVAGIVASRALF